MLAKENTVHACSQRQFSNPKKKETKIINEMEEKQMEQNVKYHKQCLHQKVDKQ